MAVVSPALTDRLAQLRDEARRCRSQAIVLNAKLALLESERGDLHAVRLALAASAARVDHAVDDIVNDVESDITACEPPPPASPRP